MPAKKMILNIENHTPYPAYISLLGGLQDPNQYNINAQTEYLYDIGNYNKLKTTPKGGLQSEGTVTSQ